MRSTNAHRRERGTQVAELALVLPFLCMIVFLVVEGAGMVRAHMVINNAAREGARLSADPANQPNSTTNPVPQIRNAVKNYVTSNGVSCQNNPDVQINQTAPFAYNNGSTTVSGTASIVTILCTYQFEWLPSFMGGSSTVNLQASAEFRNFY